MYKRQELEWMRRMPQARGHKARYREEAFYELENVAKQRFNDGNVKLDMNMLSWCIISSRNTAFI